MTEIITSLDINEKAMTVSISSYHLSIDPALQTSKIPFKQTLEFDNELSFNLKLLKCFQAYCDGSCDFSTTDGIKWLQVFKDIVKGMKATKDYGYMLDTYNSYNIPHTVCSTKDMQIVYYLSDHLMPYVCRKMIQASKLNKVQ